ncbi:DUF3189 family protein [Sutcliffiella rhizosphaerae]|uniref:DUF3189 family protein n=1 Tax=Sutcliffiella rhizosphaerae TaxID=2880967 RepID=UPI001E58DB33|nr:DUF3189 family protein [Sutcliffiella rhizosphaerae]
MIYIYNDFGGTHSTALAAAYHLKLLSKHQKLTKEDVLNVPFFNKLTPDEKGIFFFHGYDEEHNAVYSVGRHSSKIAVKSLVNLCKLFNESYQLDQKIIFTNTSPTVPFPMTIGGFFSRVLKFDFIGVPLLIWGAKISYKDVVNLVDNTKQEAMNSNEKVIKLDNIQYK